MRTYFARFRARGVGVGGNFRQGQVSYCFKTTYKNGILTIALPLMKEEQTEEIISEIED